MARTQTLVQLTEELVASLDVEADRRGVSRSHLIRDAVEAYLAEGREDRTTAALVDGYRTRPQGGDDDWGSLEGLRAEARLRILRRLDDEAALAGEEW